MPLAGADIFETSKPPLGNFEVMHNDLLTNANLAKWPEIQDNKEKKEEKKKWRRMEAQALEAWIKDQEK